MLIVQTKTGECILPDERTDLVSTNRLGHGCSMLSHAWYASGHTRHWPISKPCSEVPASMAVIGCEPRRRFVETKAVRWTLWLKGLTMPPYYLSFYRNELNMNVGINIVFVIKIQSSYENNVKLIQKFVQLRSYNINFIEYQI